jgi:uncharacterized protein
MPLRYAFCVETHAQPVTGKERFAVLDLVRGFALFGVLLINLLYFFRVSLFSHMLEPLSSSLLARLVEFKAFDLFALTFGAGVAVQWERGSGSRFLARRFLVLLGFGLVHMTLVSNVDILMLYSICGLALIPLLRLPTVVLATVGAALALGPSILPDPSLPDIPTLRAHAVEATRIYGSAGYATQVAFRWHETLRLVVPLLIAVAQKVLGLMLTGVAVWRSGVVRDPAPRRGLLAAVAAVGIAAGIVLYVDVILAAGYGAALLAANPQGRWTRPFAAAGRMAFTNYLTQSLVFATAFYGFGLFGKMAEGPAAAFGIGLYAAQLGFSAWWLRRHRFGPFEWAWRSLTYGRRL